MPVFAVEIVNEANVAGVTVELVPPPTAAVVPSVPVVPDVPPVFTPPMVLPPDVLVLPEAIRQLVSTVSATGPVLPWQIDTAPEPPPTTARLAGVPFTAVMLARFGRATIVVEITEVLLVQVGVTQESV